MGGTAALTAASDDDGGKREYKLLFDNAFGLVEGGDFRVGGVKAGQTSAFSIVKKDGRALAEVTAEISEPGFADLRADATCATKPQSLIGEYYVDCEPGDSEERLPAGGTITGGPHRAHHPAGPDQRHPAPPRARAPAPDRLARSAPAWPAARRT